MKDRQTLFIKTRVPWIYLGNFVLFYTNVNSQIWKTLSWPMFGLKWTGWCLKSDFGECSHPSYFHEYACPKSTFSLLLGTTACVFKILTTKSSHRYILYFLKRNIYINNKCGDSKAQSKQASIYKVTLRECHTLFSRALIF